MKCYSIEVNDLNSVSKVVNETIEMEELIKVSDLQVIKIHNTLYYIVFIGTITEPEKTDY